MVVVHAGVDDADDHVRRARRHRPGVRRVDVRAGERRADAGVMQGVLLGKERVVGSDGVLKPDGVIRLNVLEVADVAEGRADDAGAGGGGAGDLEQPVAAELAHDVQAVAQPLQLGGHQRHLHRRRPVHPPQ